MERRAASHTEEEEMNQRRRLLNLARKGDPKAISRLFELYQVRIYSGNALSKRKVSTPSSVVHQKSGKTPVRKRPAARRSGVSRRVMARKSPRKVAHR
jgi:hypothetical protein